MKHAIIFSLLGALTLVSQGTAQNPPTRSTPHKSDPGAVPTASKPLTPKSAMPAKRKSSVTLPADSSTRNTSAELSHLERQKTRTNGAKGADKGSQKIAPKAETSAANGSGVNFKYKKPAGGMKAATPDPNTRNSPTPRVKKN